jgi:hypothetical protein
MFKIILAISKWLKVDSEKNLNVPCIALESLLLKIA